MDNLLGAEIAQIPEGVSAEDRPVAYGKAEAKAGRKMAHITRRRLRT
jgi:5-(carboxyamino)imidazole ribonucleotide synthase